MRRLLAPALACPVLTASGGAAKAAPRSMAYLDYLQRSEQWLVVGRLEPWVGVQDGLAVPGAKYDLKSFKITLKYSMLVTE